MYTKSIVSYIKILDFDHIIRNSSFGDALHVMEGAKFFCEYTDTNMFHTCHSALKSK